MKSILTSLVLCAVTSEAEDTVTPYEVPAAPANAQFLETFQDGDYRWKSNPEKDGVTRVGQVEGASVLDNEQGLILENPAKHYGIAAEFPKPVDVSNGFVFQYEVRLHNGLQCGGAYVKLLSEGFTPETIDGSTPYVVMFGPDKCGDSGKVHLIFRTKNAISGEWEEKHLKESVLPKSDSFTHLYTLIVREDDTYEIQIDQRSVQQGSLNDDFSPAFQPPTEIDDPTDSKPEDWVDDAKIVDPEATKPDDWDEDAPRLIADESDVKPSNWLDDAPLTISDPDATVPEDWFEEDDGEWEAPMIPNPACAQNNCGEWSQKQISNPAYKGQWVPPLIDNPEYKGEWTPAQIPNPNYHEVPSATKALSNMGGAGIEVWTMQNNIEFDNLLLTTDSEEAAAFGADTWGKKHAYEVAQDPLASRGVVDFLKDFVEEVKESPMKLGVFTMGTVLLLYVVYAGCCAAEDESTPTRAPSSATTAPVARPVVVNAKAEEEDEEEEEEDDEEDEQEDVQEDETPKLRQRSRKA